MAKEIDSAADRVYKSKGSALAQRKTVVQVGFLGFVEMARQEDLALHSSAPDWVSDAELVVLSRFRQLDEKRTCSLHHVVCVLVVRERDCGPLSVIHVAFDEEQVCVALGWTEIRPPRVVGRRMWSGIAVQDRFEHLRWIRQEKSHRVCCSRCPWLPQYPRPQWGHPLPR